MKLKISDDAYKLIESVDALPVLMDVQNFKQLYMIKENLKLEALRENFLIEAVIVNSIFDSFNNYINTSYKFDAHTFKTLTSYLMDASTESVLSGYHESVVSEVLAILSASMSLYEDENFKFITSLVISLVDSFKINVVDKLVNLDKSSKSKTLHYIAAKVASGNLTEFDVDKSTIEADNWPSVNINVIAENILIIAQRIRSLKATIAEKLETVTDKDSASYYKAQDVFDNLNKLDLTMTEMLYSQL